MRVGTARGGVGLVFDLRERRLNGWHCARQGWPVGARRAIQTIGSARVHDYATSPTESPIHMRPRRPTVRRGRTKSYPRPQLDRQSTSPRTLTSAEVAKSCTLDHDYPANQPLHARRPPPKAQNRAPSTPVRPPTDPSTHADLHRRRKIVHPRPQLDRQPTPPRTLTSAEGAKSCTLDHDYPANQPLKAPQPASKAHHRAPSTPVMPKPG